MSYNGWSNYETWNVALWIDNDPGTYELAREWATDAVENPDPSAYLDPEEVAIRDVAERLKDFVEENNPLSGEASMYADILGANLSEVNYHEIAKHWVEEVSEEAKA